MKRLFKVELTLTSGDGQTTHVNREMEHDSECKDLANIGWCFGGQISFALDALRSDLCSKDFQDIGNAILVHFEDTAKEIKSRMAGITMKE